MRGMLQPNTSFLHTFNLPIIRPLCNIAHLFECVAMFYFIKRLSVFRIATQPLTNRFLYFCYFVILLHYAFDVSGFGWSKD